MLAIRNHLLDASVRRNDPDAQPEHKHPVRDAMTARLKDVSRMAHRGAELFQSETPPKPFSEPVKSYSEQMKAMEKSGARLGAVDQFKENLHRSEKAAAEHEPHPAGRGEHPNVQEITPLANNAEPKVQGRLDRVFYNEDLGDLSDPYEIRR